MFRTVKDKILGTRSLHQFIIDSGLTLNCIEYGIDGGFLYGFHFHKDGTVFPITDEDRKVIDYCDRSAIDKVASLEIEEKYSHLVMWSPDRLDGDGKLEAISEILNKINAETFTHINAGCFIVPIYHITFRA